MLRHCDGTDSGLLKRVDPPVFKSDGLHQFEPCDCGEEFDDVEASIIFPHEKFFDRTELAFNGRSW